MSSFRRKRKPDAIQLNLVTRGKRARVSAGAVISKVTAPIVHETASTSSSSASLFDVAASTTVDMRLEDVQEYPMSEDHDDEALLSVFNPAALAHHVESEHTHRKQRSAEAWEKYRPVLSAAAISCFCVPSNEKCISCAEVSAEVLCEDCGPHAYYCCDCAVKVHGTVNITHSPLLWKVS